MPYTLSPEQRAAGQHAKQAAKDAATFLASSNLDLPPRTLAKVLARLTQMPQGRRRSYLHALRGKAPKTAIRDFCAMCIGWIPGEVKACSDPACPLYPYRTNP